MCGIGVCFHKNTAVSGLNAVLISVKLFELADLSLPHAISDTSHGIAASVPVVKITDNRNAHGSRSPNSESKNLASSFFSGVNTKKLIGFIILSLIKQIKRKIILILIVRHRFSLLCFLHCTII